MRHEQDLVPCGPANRDRPIFRPGVIWIQECQCRGIANTDAAASKETRCFRALAAVLAGSHSYVTPAGYHRPYDGSSVQLLRHEKVASPSFLQVGQPVLHDEPIGDKISGKNALRDGDAEASGPDQRAEGEPAAHAPAREC